MDTPTLPAAEAPADELVLVDSLLGDQSEMMTRGELDHAEGMGWSATEPVGAEPVAVEPVAEPTLASRQAAGLRALADMIEANPEVAEHLRYTFGHMGVPLIVQCDGEIREALARLVRAGKAHGATIDKTYNGQWAGANLNWADGAVTLRVTADRNEVCERVVTGTDTVIRTVPDPAALAAVPTIEVTETVERVEWICKPLLADDTTEATS